MSRKELWHPIMVGSELIFLLAGSGLGLYYRRMAERWHRATLADTRACIESRIRLETEREQQEQLLLSVIPAYIAAEITIDPENDRVSPKVDGSDRIVW
ncbi:unnamed protein product [Nezara viridula]|uniref:Adenylate cyclase N-terminal domain-containing protein n=1 Tax=Nezara viridula TaxID=85310 RepID=A0A9P0HAA5_NEZVI|nr:unnamed protein product [Nezara viridula]